MKHGKLIFRLYIIAILTTLAAAGALLFYAFFMHREPEIIYIPKDEPIYEALDDEISDEATLPDPADALTEALRGTASAGLLVKEALEERPPLVDLTAYDKTSFVSVDSCLITGSDEITLTASAPGYPVSDDKYYYLFELPVYEDSLSDGAEPVTKAYKSDAMSFSMKLNRSSSSSRLYRKFLLAVKQDGAYIPVSHSSYVTNPEYVASYNYSGMSHSSKKGLLVDPFKTEQLTDLGVQYATYNIPLNRILTTQAAGSVAYSYCGVTYYFNAAILREYDHLFQLLNNKGIDIAAILLNNASTSAYPEITHPKARSGSTAPYYMFNGSDQAGVQALSAVASFLASRYSGSGHGSVSMWIVGNEINARKEWNYMAPTDINSYTAAYTQAFRVIYNAIKSVNGQAMVYAPFDQQWDRNRKSNPDYDARDMLDIFAASIKAHGDINWGLAEHPYSYPNNNTPFWKPSKLVTHSYDTSILTMENIEILTSYMENEALLAPDGSVRSIILSEMGYSSTSGEALQAAAFAYAYRKIEANPHIDAMMLSRQTDASEEISAFGLALGLTSTGGHKKQIYDIFKIIDTPGAYDALAFARNIIGRDF